MSVLDQQIVLSLNKNWQRIGWRSVRQALISMNGGSYGKKTRAIALDITIEDGLLTSAIPTNWDDWIKLPVRAPDLALQTKSGPIRCPLVIISPAFGDMPVKRPRLSSGTIRDRDGQICQYTGRKLTQKQGNIDHILPKSLGGKDSWENLVWCDKEVNLAKGNRLNHQAGLTLIRKPKAPKDVPALFMIRQPRHPHHAPFIT